MASEAQHEGFAAGKALMEAYIRAIGGDPQRPTKKQAKAAAGFLLDVAAAMGAERTSADEIFRLYEEIKRERQ